MDQSNQSAAARASAARGTTSDGPAARVLIGAAVLAVAAVFVMLQTSWVLALIAVFGVALLVVAAVVHRRDVERRWSKAFLSRLLNGHARAAVTGLADETQLRPYAADLADFEPENGQVRVVLGFAADRMEMRTFSRSLTIGRGSVMWQAKDLALIEQTINNTRLDGGIVIVPESQPAIFVGTKRSPGELRAVVTQSLPSVTFARVESAPL